LLVSDQSNTLDQSLSSKNAFVTLDPDLNVEIYVVCLRNVYITIINDKIEEQSSKTLVRMDY
jgi:hypothetical protein